MPMLLMLAVSDDDEENPFHNKKKKIARTQHTTMRTTTVSLALYEQADFCRHYAHSKAFHLPTYLNGLFCLEQQRNYTHTGHRACACIFMVMNAYDAIINNA